MNKNYFIFNNKQYFPETLIQIKTECRKDFGFYSILKFIRYNNDNNLYYFSSLFDKWHYYKLTYQELLDCIDKVQAEGLPIQTSKLNPAYVDGIVEAWVWYILIMIFAVFVKGIGETLIVWIVATIIFFQWRYKKINGGQ